MREFYQKVRFTVEEKLEHDLSRFGEGVRLKFVLGHFLGNYLLSWVLDEGKALKREGLLRWNVREDEERVASRIREAFKGAVLAFRGSDDAGIENLVDWQRLARQMIFFMGGEYHSYANRDLPEGLYEISDVRITPGDGWGYIHEEVVRRRLRLSGQELGNVMSRYFQPARSDRRQIPEGLRVFVSDFEKRWEEEKDSRLKGLLGELFKEYGQSWRFDGEFEDLGPVNGPLPLTELVKALYVYVMHMVNSGPQLERGPPASEQPNSRDTHLIPVSGDHAESPEAPPSFLKNKQHSYQELSHSL